LASAIKSSIRRAYTRTMPSPPAVASFVPSRLKATPKTPPVWPVRVSFIKTLRLLRCALFEAQIVAREQFEHGYGRLLERIGRMRLPVRDNRCNPRVVRRKMSNFDLKRDKHRQLPQPTQSFAEAVVILGATLALPLSVCAQAAPI
jgi:hypothetical protein